MTHCALSRLLLSRGIILALGIGVSVAGIAPFDASSEMSTRSLSEKAGCSVWDRLVLRYLGCFAHWDGAYFVQISQFGYEHEKVHAFFPALPLILRAAVRAAQRGLGLHFHFRTLAILAAILWNGFLCSFLAAMLLYHLTRRVDRRWDRPWAPWLVLLSDQHSDRRWDLMWG